MSVALPVNNRQLYTLHAVIASASSSLDLDTTLQEVVKRTTEAINFDSTRIYLLNPHGDELLLRAFLESKAGLFALDRSCRLGQGIIGRVVETDEPVIFENVQEDHRYQRLSSRKTVQRAGFRFFGVFPIKCKARTMGAIVCTSHDSRHLTQDEIQLITSMGYQVGIAVVNADLLEETRKSLAEKEVLLKEVNHRVKNNLQVISSLLNLQSAHLKDRQSLEIFKESQNRVRVIALAHKHLYRHKNLARINVGDYIQSLTGELFSAYRPYANSVTLKVNAADVLIEIDSAIPCGLIINELVTNSLRYAFPAGRTGEITIDLRLDNNKFTLLVRDNGVGLPNGLDFRNTESLGLQLVKTLTDQLDGTIELDKSCGTEFRIIFPHRILGH